ncbi:MAG: menaquinone biosynthetic enzyme MqnA/MqnD family protein [Bryobacteraceae bacterium]
MLHFGLKPEATALHDKVRVCAVSYLNTVPLVWGMLSGPQRGVFDLSFCVPSECADRLEDGTADIGIVPCAELLKQRLEIVPGVGIASRGAVRSILLVSKTPFGQIGSVATDSSSRTSVMLTRIVLAQRYGVEPKLISMPPDLDAMLQAADAALIIGDPALRLDPSCLPYRVLDLGAEWDALTGLPMVFAVWAGRSEVINEEVRRAFAGSCDYGLVRLEEIVAAEAPGRGVGEALAREYLSRHIVFKIGKEEEKGLERFLQYAAGLPSVETLDRVSV